MISTKDIMNSKEMVDMLTDQIEAITKLNPEQLKVYMQVQELLLGKVTPVLQTEGES